MTRSNSAIDDELLRGWVAGAPALSEEAIRSFEKRSKLTLPADYREFLLKVNGGRPPHERCVFVDGIVSMFLGLGHEDEDFDVEARISASWARPPHKDLMLIAYDAGGAPIYLCIRGEHVGEVWWLNTSDLQPPGPKSRTQWYQRKDMHRIGETFVGFLRSLTSYDDIETH